MCKIRRSNTPFLIFCINSATFLHELFVHNALAVKKHYQHRLHFGILEAQFLRSWRMFANPLGALALCFGIAQETPTLVTCIYLVQKFLVTLSRNLKVSHPRCVVKNKYVIIQAETCCCNIVINLVLCLVVFCDCKNKIFFTYLLSRKFLSPLIMFNRSWHVATCSSICSRVSACGTNLEHSFCFFKSPLKIRRTTVFGMLSVSAINRDSRFNLL